MLTKSYSPKVGFVSLGCPKAGSDTEKILSRVKAEGYEISSNFINLINHFFLIPAKYTIFL